MKRPKYGGGGGWRRLVAVQRWQRWQAVADTKHTHRLDQVQVAGTLTGRQGIDKGRGACNERADLRPAQDGKDAESDDDKRAPAPSIKMWLI